MSEFQRLVGDQRPLDAMSRAQVGLVMGLEKVLRDAGLVLVCRHCVADGDAHLDTNNSAADEIWKIDCKCRRRRIARIDAMMVPSGWLLLMKDDLLEPLALDVRCPSRRCLLQPLKIHQSLDGMTLTVTCHCGGVYKFSKTKQSRPN